MKCQAKDRAHTVHGAAQLGQSYLLARISYRDESRCWSGGICNTHRGRPVATNHTQQPRHPELSGHILSYILTSILKIQSKPGMVDLVPI